MLFMALGNPPITTTTTTTTTKKMKLPTNVEMECSQGCMNVCIIAT